MPDVHADPVADRRITLKKLFHLGYYPGKLHAHLVQQMIFLYRSVHRLNMLTRCWENCNHQRLACTWSSYSAVALREGSDEVNGVGVWYMLFHQLRC